MVTPLDNWDVVLDATGCPYSPTPIKTKVVKNVPEIDALKQLTMVTITSMGPPCFKWLELHHLTLESSSRLFRFRSGSLEDSNSPMTEVHHMDNVRSPIPMDAMHPFVRGDGFFVPRE